MFQCLVNRVKSTCLCSRALSILFYAPAIVLFTGGPVAGSDSKELRRRFNEEYVDAVKTLRDFYRGVQMRIQYKFTPVEGQPPTKVYEQRVGTYGPLVRYVRRVQKGSTDRTVGEMRVYVANPRASFMLAKSPTDAKYRVERLLEATTAKGAIAFSARPLFAPFAVMDEMVPTMIKSDEFEIVETTEFLQKDGPRLVRVNWRRQVDKSSALKQTGWFLFDPKRYWALHEFGIHFRPSGDSYAIMHGKVFYEGARAGVPLVQRVHCYLQKHRLSDQQPIGKKWEISEYDVETIIAKPLPEEEFKMAAFGLPNPGDVTQPGTVSRIVWGLVILAVLAALGFWLLGRRRKDAVRDSPAGQ